MTAATLLCIQLSAPRLHLVGPWYLSPLGPLPHPPLDEQARPARKWLRGW